MPSEPKAAGAFSFGSKTWPGLAKLVEESGEVLQISGKLMMTGGDPNHWSGDLSLKMESELADTMAAIFFFIDNNPQLNGDRIADMLNTKMATFTKWHEEGQK